MEENEIFKSINKNNPHPGKPFEDWRVISNNGEKLYRVYSWMTGLNSDILVSGYKILKELKKYIGNFITRQIYYDIVCLGLQSIEERPKCVICGKSVTFDSFRRGYKMSCSNNCEKIIKQKIMEKNHDSLRGKPVSLETRKKLSSSHKGRIPKAAVEARSKQLKSFSRTEEGKLFYKKLGEENSKRNIQRIISNNVNNKYGGNNKFKRGHYKSSILSQDFWYDSSWELAFIKYIEKLFIKGDIKVFTRCRYYIEYINPDDGKIHRYIPDFYIEFNSGMKLVIELKPERLVKSSQLVISKKIAAKKYFKKMDIHYIILTESELFISRKEKYYSKRINKRGKLKNSFNIYDYIV